MNTMVHPRPADSSAALRGFGPTLVIAPHPDDEVLGAGGMIARLASAGEPVTVAVVTSGRPPAWPAERTKAVRAEAERAHRRLGVVETLWLDQPAAELGQVPHAILNAAIAEVVKSVGPRTLLVPHPGDIHLDHQVAFLSSMVAARPHQAAYPRRILAYETLSETNWNAPYLSPPFLPQLFIDIEETLEAKLEAMRLFASQLREPPHERSLKAIEALATLRGATVHRRAAEAFVVIRDVI